MGYSLAAPTFTARTRAQKIVLEAVLWDDPTECLITDIGCNNHGYPLFRVSVDGKSTKFRAHRVVCQLAHGPAPSDKHEALHSLACTSRACINPFHLRWGTHAENMHDAALAGSQKGENNPQAQLTEAQVYEIREAPTSTSNVELAEQYGVHHSLVSLIRLRRIWNHLPERAA